VSRTYCGKSVVSCSEWHCFHRGHDKRSMQSALQRPHKLPLSQEAPYYSQYFWSLRSQYCTSLSRNGALMLLLLTSTAANSRTKILNVPFILAPYTKSVRVDGCPKNRTLQETHQGMRYRKVTALYFAFNSPDGGEGFRGDDLCKILHGGQRMTKTQNSFLRNIVESFNPLSRAHERYWRQTDLR